MTGHLATSNERSQLPEARSKENAACRTHPSSSVGSPRSPPARSVGAGSCRAPGSPPSQPSSAPAATARTPHPTRQSTANAVSKEIDTLAVGFPASLSNLYPGKEAGIVNYYVAALVGEGLVAPDSIGVLQPALAKSWKQTSPTTYVYTLRDDAMFSDGVPVTIDDVIYSIGMAQDKKISPNIAYYWANTKSVDKTADNEVTITLDSPDVAFEWGPCAANALWVTSQEFVESNNGEIGTPSTLIYGTGPYKVTKFEPDSMVELERVDTWWGGSAPVKTVRIDFIPEEATRLLARQRETSTWRSTSRSTRRRRGRTPRTPPSTSPPTAATSASTSTSRPHPSTTSTFAAPSPTPATARPTWTSCSMVTARRPRRSRPPSRSRVSTAPKVLARRSRWSSTSPTTSRQRKSELAQSKVPDGFTTKVGISNSAPQVSAAFQVLKQAVEPLGIIIEIDEMPVEQWYDTIGSKDWGLAYMDYTSTTGDPAEMSSWFLGPYGPAGYTNDEVTALMDQVMKETDPEKRADTSDRGAARRHGGHSLHPPVVGRSGHGASSDEYTIEDFGSYTFVSPWTPRILTNE